MYAIIVDKIIIKYLNNPVYVTVNDQDKLILFLLENKIFEKDELVVYLKYIYKKGDYSALNCNIHKYIVLCECPDK